MQRRELDHLKSDSSSIQAGVGTPFHAAVDSAGHHVRAERLAQTRVEREQDEARVVGLVCGQARP